MKTLTVPWTCSYINTLGNQLISLATLPTELKMNPLRPARAWRQGRVQKRCVLRSGGMAFTMDWVGFPANSYVGALTLHVTILEIGSLRTWLRLSEGIRMEPYFNGTGTLIREEESPAHSPTGRHSSPGPNDAGTTISNFQPPETVGNTFLLLKSLSLWFFMAAEQTNTVSEQRQ